MRLILPITFLLLAAAPAAFSQQASLLPDAPSHVLFADPGSTESSSSLAQQTIPQQQDATQAAKQSDKRKPGSYPAGTDLDVNGNPIPLNRQQPRRILGVLPNYRAVSAGAIIPRPGWEYNFHVATRQAFDYSSFVFLGITSLSAEALDEHKSFGKGVGGFYSYTWHGFLDKTDNTYLGAWLLPSLLHEDTRFYADGNTHKLSERILYIISRQFVARRYPDPATPDRPGKNTPNIAGQGSKILTQYISRFYYPTGSTDFASLAEKYAYSNMRDIVFSAIREFIPDISAHYKSRRVEKESVRLAAQQSPAGDNTKPKQP